jgi:small-conductance mechanosensitive channel
MSGWGTDTIWLDIAVFLVLLLISEILFGHFEDFKPKWRRILKVIMGLALFTAVITFFGRFWGWIFFILPIAVGIVVVHGWWLPRNGINGWTGEPREKYLELVKARK